MATVPISSSLLFFLLFSWSSAPRTKFFFSYSLNYFSLFPCILLQFIFFSFLFFSFLFLFLFGRDPRRPTKPRLHLADVTRSSKLLRHHRRTSSRGPAPWAAAVRLERLELHRRSRRSKLPPFAFPATPWLEKTSTEISRKRWSHSYQSSAGAAPFLATTTVDHCGHSAGIRHSRLDLIPSSRELRFEV